MKRKVHSGMGAVIPQDKNLARKMVIEACPIRDNPACRIYIYGPRPKIEAGRGGIHRYYNQRPVWDVTSIVLDLVKRGELKRERRFDLSFGRRNYTFFVVNEE